MKNEKYDKIFSLDTNIILDNAMNIATLSDKSKNLIVLPETVLDEIDSKKSGFNEINFQARSFARLLYDAKIEKKEVIDDITIIKTTVTNITIFIISKNIYKADSDNVSGSIKNDRKILEITKDLQSIKGFETIRFISLDVMARTRAISLGIDTESFNMGIEELDIEKDFHMEIPMEEYLNKRDYEIPDYISSIVLTEETGNKEFYFRDRSDKLIEIDDKNSHRLSVPPLNVRQKVFTELILNETDIVVCSGPAGTGKTILGLSAAMRLMDLHKDKYTNIAYLRRTVISGTSEDELGFLPGDLSEKMAGYNQPMIDSVKKVAQLKKKNQTKEELEERIEKLMEHYNINFIYGGHLRGSTLDEGTILICDECLSDNNIIMTDKGYNNIVDIENKLLNGDEINVLSYNIENEIYEYKPMLSLKKEHISNTKEKMYKVTMEDGSSIEITGNHKLLMDGEYKTLNSIKEDFDNVSVKTQH